MTNHLELWLVRHGETTYNASRLLAGWSDPPLTPLGRTQAAAAKSVIDGTDFDHVWSSDLDRAISTARLAWGEPTVDRRLREINFGELEGRGYEEVDADFTQVFLRFRDFQIPGGEDFGVFRDRVHDFLSEIRSGRHLLFVHGGVIRVLTQDLGLNEFVAPATVVGLGWTRQRLLFVKQPNTP